MSRKCSYLLEVLLTKKDLFTGYILTGGDTGASDLDEKGSRINPPSVYELLLNLNENV